MCLCVSNMNEWMNEYMCLGVYLTGFMCVCKCICVNAYMCIWMDIFDWVHDCMHLCDLVHVCMKSVGLSNKYNFKILMRGIEPDKATMQSGGGGLNQFYSN